VKPLQEDTFAAALGRTKFGQQNLEHRPDGPGRFQIKVFGDTEAVVAGDGAFIMEVPQDLHEVRLQDARAFVTTVAGGTVTVQVRNIDNGNVDMLSTPITIDAGEKSSRTAATPPVINQANNRVDAGDQLGIDVDVGGGMGLGVIIGFW